MLHQDLILLDMQEDYNTETSHSILPYKTGVWFLFAADRFPNAPFVLKTDDDSYVDIDRLQTELSGAPGVAGTDHDTGPSALHAGRSTRVAPGTRATPRGFAPRGCRFRSF